MSRDPLPEPWRTALESKGISSKRGLATKVGISPQTAKRLIDGEGKPSPETVAAVADELFNGDRTRVWELAGESRQDYGDWQLPAEASQLDPDQRAAVLAVVRAMLPPEVRRGETGGDTPATKAPGSGPGTVTQLPTAARDVGKLSKGQQRRRNADQAGEPPVDDPDDLEPR